MLELPSPVPWPSEPGHSAHSEAEYQRTGVYPSSVPASDDETGTLSECGSDPDVQADNVAYAAAYDALGSDAHDAAVESFAAAGRERYFKDQPVMLCKGREECPPWSVNSSVCPNCGHARLIPPSPEPENEPMSDAGSASDTTAAAASAASSPACSAAGSAASSRRSSVSVATVPTVATSAAAAAAPAPDKVVYGVPAGATALPTFFVRLVGRRNVGSLRVFDLSVPRTANFGAAGLTPHNCAIPGIYSPVELLKKDEKTGKLTPYMEGGAPVKWEDGSVQADLPMQRLSELFNVNHFIVSQVNPHVAPLVSSMSSTHTLQQSFLTAPVPKLLDYLLAQLKSTTLNFLHLNILPIHPSVKYLLDQKYLGDITIVPHVRPADYTQLLVNPTPERLRECILQSEASTWRLIPTIRGACEIEFTLDECVRRMRGTLILEELSDARRLSKHMSRVRSWSSDLLAVGQRAGTSSRCDSSVVVMPNDTCGRIRDGTLPSMGGLAARTRSEAAAMGMGISPESTHRSLSGQAAFLSHAREQHRWVRKHVKQPSVKRSHTVLTLAKHASPRRFGGRRGGGGGGGGDSGEEGGGGGDRHLLEHEAEDDDIVSEEEEEAHRRAQLRWEQGHQSDPDADQADLHLANGEEEEEEEDENEGEGSRNQQPQCIIDDEGIPRQCVPLPTPPVVSPPPAIPSLPASAASAPPAVVADGTSPATAPVPTPATVAASSALSSPSLSAESSGSPRKASSLRPASRSRSGSGKRVNIFSPMDTPTRDEHHNNVVPEWRVGGPSVYPEGALLPPVATTSASPMELPAPALFSPPTDPGATVTPISPFVVAEVNNIAARVQQQQQHQQQQPPSSPQVQFMAPPRRRGENERAVSAHAISSAIGASAARPPMPPRSRPRTPDPIPAHQLRPAGTAEWSEEQAASSPVLSQLLKTTQAKVSRGGPARSRNVRSNLQQPPQQPRSSSGSPSLLIPSLVNFRHTPPRRMSTMDLARLEDDATAEAATTASPFAHAHTLPHAASHHSHSFHSAVLHHQQRQQQQQQQPQVYEPISSGGDETSDNDEARLRASAPPVSAAATTTSLSEDTSLSGWLHRASSFFTGEEDHLQAMRARDSRRRSQSDSAPQSAPQSPVATDSEPPSPESPTSDGGGDAAGGGGGGVELESGRGSGSGSGSGSGGGVRRAAHHPLSQLTTSGRPGVSHPPLVVSSAAHLAADRERLRATARFAAAASMANPNPILRAASSGLPRTLSQIELVSDVGTMP